MAVASFIRVQKHCPGARLAVALLVALCVLGEAVAVSLAQDAQWAIYVMRTDGSQVRKLVEVAGCREHATPRWSHDGKRVAFFASTRTWLENSVYVVNADGGELRQLAPHARPDWSPDDKQIVYDYYPGGTGSEVYVQDLNGQGRTQISVGCSPRWSPDGSRLAVSEHDNVFVMDLVTGDAHKLFDDAVATVFNGFSWSPDGSRLVVIVRRKEKARRQCLIVSAAGERQGIRKRAEGDMGGYVSFSPDGKQLVYDDLWKIRILDVDGSGGPRLVPGQKGRNRQPDWSPDGKWIVFVSDRELP